jgi:ADP-heptose:LPS heptosyltransferase
VGAHKHPLVPGTMIFDISKKRPVTRLPYPLRSQLRTVAVAFLFRLLGWLLAPVFRRSVTLDELASARLLLLKPCCLGDVVFSTALVRELRRALPNAHLTFGVGTHARPAIASHPALDDLLDTGTIGSGSWCWSDLLRLVRAIRARRFDACFVLERSAVLALVPLLAGIPTRVGIDSGGRGFSLSVAVPVRPARPESELYLDLLRAVGGTPRSGELEYHPSHRSVRRVEELVRTRLPSDRPFVVLHCAGGTNPGMTLLRKRWPVESFRELARRIVEAGGTVVLVGSEEERDALLGFGSLQRSALPPAVLTSCSGEASPRGASSQPPTPDPRPPVPIVDLVGQLTLDELAALARRAAVYVGNDTGPSHVAEAAGANVVMLFGPSDPIVYGPRCRRAVALTAGLWCSPCFENGRVAPCANVLCMPSISVERVWHEVSRFLAPHECVR